tara:strand:+ start:6707 stop:7738 length:1032 start_codon:yes stop_codon:yes gene_type:complete
MFKEYNLNKPSKNGNNSGNAFCSEGICRISEVTSETKNISLNDLRDNIENEFNYHNFPRGLSLVDVKNKKIIKDIETILESTYLKNFFEFLENETQCGPISLLPLQENIMRNYFSGPQYGKHGWHRDASKEYQYAYCKKIMNTKKYIYGKISIALQPNSEKGGNIDIIPQSFSPNDKWPKRVRVMQFLSDSILKYKYGRTINPFKRSDWLIDSFYGILKPRKVSPKPLEIISFDHRIEHRGSPQTPKSWSNLKQKFPDIKIEKQRLIPVNKSLEKYNKYIIYFHFGCAIGLSSSFYARTRLEGWQKEKSILMNQLNNLNIFQKIFPNSRTIFSNALKMIDEEN